jgi:hypothetical protein
MSIATFDKYDIKLLEEIIRLRLGESQMDYLAYLLDGQHHIIDVRPFVEPDDQAALSHAYHMRTVVEVWRRAHRVGVIPREPTSIEVED